MADYTMKEKGWFQEAQAYGEALGHVSNYPLCYVYAMFLALSGHLLGRRAYIRYGTPLYANNYICLVGPSAISHKSTAMKLGIESLGDLRQVYRPLSHISTSQGLYLSMSENNGTALIVLDEIANMLNQKNQTFASNLISSLTELYGCPDHVGTYTRMNPINVDDTFVSLISGSTLEWLQTTLTVSDLMGGFGNRMTFVVGDPRPENPWPRLPYLDDLNWEPLLQYSGQVFLEETARDVWDTFYNKFANNQRDSPPFIRVLAERIPEKILKAAVVMAAWQGAKFIEADMLEAAIDWGRYLRKGLERLAPAFEQAEHQVVQAIIEGYDTKAKLFGVMSHNTDTRRLKEAVSNAEWLGKIRMSNDGTHFEVIG